MHLDLLDSVPKSGVQRQKIMDFIHGLREHPNIPGDFTDKDVSLQERQIKIIGDYAITYWLDAAVWTVMVVDVRPADK
jgi:hypothetical protein